MLGQALVQCLDRRVEGTGDQECQGWVLTGPVVICHSSSNLIKLVDYLFEDTRKGRLVTGPTFQQILDRYERAFGVVDDVVVDVSPQDWPFPSACPDWSARDVLAHLLWGQALVAAWACGLPAPVPNGTDWTEAAPDAQLATLWAQRRDTTQATLTPDALERPVTTSLFGTLSLGEFIWTLPNDALLHAWDLAAAVGYTPAIPDDLAEWFLAWGREHEAALRRPGGYGPAIDVPHPAHILTRWLAFAGRDARATATRPLDARQSPTVSSVFYDTTDMAQAVSVFVDLLGYPRPSSQQSTPGWTELDAQPTVFVRQVDHLDGHDANFAVRVPDLDAVHTAARREPTATADEVFEVEPGVRAFSLHPATAQRVLVHE